MDWGARGCPRIPGASLRTWVQAAPDQNSLLLLFGFLFLGFSRAPGAQEFPFPPFFVFIFSECSGAPSLLFIFCSVKVLRCSTSLLSFSFFFLRYFGAPKTTVVSAGQRRETVSFVFFFPLVFCAPLILLLLFNGARFAVALCFFLLVLVEVRRGVRCGLRSWTSTEQPCSPF